jgi:hypothetical protein
MSANKFLQAVFNSYQVDGSRIRKSIDHAVCEQCVVISECKGGV